MNRREFLQRLGAAAIVIPSTKFIFDLGANKNQYDRGWDAWRWVSVDSDPMRGMGYYFTDIHNLPEYEEVIIESSPLIHRGEIPIYPRRFSLGCDGVMTEVLPFV